LASGFNLAAYTPGVTEHDNDRNRVRDGVASFHEPEETTMFKHEINDRFLDEILDSHESYPDEVLESEWNPVVAQIQLMKLRQREAQREAQALWLTIPEAELMD
jgi:hypothetical protein